MIYIKSKTKDGKITMQSKKVIDRNDDDISEKYEVIFNDDGLFLPVNIGLSNRDTYVKIDNDTLSKIVKKFSDTSKGKKRFMFLRK